MTIYTERLELRPTNDNDLEILFSIFTSPYVRKYLLDDDILNMDQVSDFLTLSIGNFNKSGYGLWLLESKETHIVMGFVGLWEFFEEGQPQLLYALLPQFTGNGYGLEAAIAIVNYVFSELKFPYITASCDEPNLSSQRLAGKIGMKLEKHAIVNDKPMVFYRLENTWK